MGNFEFFYRFSVHGFHKHFDLILSFTCDVKFHHLHFKIKI